MSDLTLEDFFDMAARAPEMGISLEMFYEMVPWHVLSLLDIAQLRNEERLERLKQRQNQGGLTGF